jgi:hypothetical protein
MRQLEFAAGVNFLQWKLYVHAFMSAAVGHGPGASVEDAKFACVAAMNCLLGLGG